MAHNIRISKKYEGDISVAKRWLDEKLESAGLRWASYPNGARGWEGSKAAWDEANRFYEVVQFSPGNAHCEDDSFVLPVGFQS